MKLYFATGQIPEMAGLSRQERRAIRRAWYEQFKHRHFIEWLTFRILMALAIFAVLRWADDSLHANMIETMLLMIAIVWPPLILHDIANVNRMARHMPSLLKFKDLK